MRLIIDPDRRFVLLAVPKTASTAIHRAVERSLGRRVPHGAAAEFHRTAAEARRALGAEAERYTYAAFARDPFARFASAYLDFRFGRPASPLAIRLGFEAFCREFPGSRWQADLHFRPQWEFVGDASGALLVDFLGRVESLEADWQRLALELGLAAAPLERLSFQTRGLYGSEVRSLSFPALLRRLGAMARWRYAPPARPSHDELFAAPGSRALVRRVFARDFELLGYCECP